MSACSAVGGLLHFRHHLLASPIRYREIMLGIYTVQINALYGDQLLLNQDQFFG
jgi:hypothetical protein